MKPSTQTCSLFHKSLCALALSALLGVGSVAPTLASGGSSAGGVNAGGVKAGGGGSAAGGGNAGGVKDPVGQSVVLTLNSGVIYNGALPKGTATLGYAADGTAQSLAFNLSSLKVPDGSVLPIRVIVGRLQTIFTYYQITQVTYTEYDGSITVNHGSASLSLNKANGDIVPDFTPPTPASGTTAIQIYSPDGTTLLLNALQGSFHA